MQQRAQRADQYAPRRRSRVLLGAAAVPVLLLAAACSSGSDGGDSDGGDDAKKASESAAASASPSPTVQAAAYRQLPEVCGVLPKKTLEDLVPEDTKGKEGSSGDPTTRASCSWSSLDNNGVDGSQFRWLNVSLLRFESDATRGAGDELAQEYYEKQVTDTKAVDGAKNVKSEALSGTGQTATAVRYDLKKSEGDFKQQTVIARVENVVVTLDYNGAGLAGEKTPDADELLKDAKAAAKAAVESVTKANEEGSPPSGSASGAPSEKSSSSPSAGASVAKS
ncbi:DUF3558 family protein [Streptomyces sp. NPDC093252]|uniref:DUF3558 family protein n=1 Tax=Streptomyces sp. NPDC093252 TaxID=3154980 RepID=UPI003428F0A7